MTSSDLIITPDIHAPQHFPGGVDPLDKMYATKTSMEAADAALDTRVSALEGLAFITGRNSSTLVKNANTTLSDVTGLYVPVEASSYYLWWAHIEFDSDTTPDLKTQWTLSGATGNATYITFIFGTYGVYGIVPNSSYTADGLGVGVTATIDYFGSLVTTSAGNFQFQAAQSTSNASNTTVHADCLVAAVKIA